MWGTNSAGQIFRRNGLGAGWEHIPGGAVQASCQDYANAVVVNGADEMFKFNGSGWDVLPGRAKWASMGADGALWCVNAASQIFRHEGGGWVHVEGGAVQVAVGDARNVWVLNGGGELFRWLGGNGWDKVPAPPGITRVAVSAGSERVVALAPGAIYAWAGATWVLLPGGLTNVAVNEGHIVGTNGASEIFTVAVPGGTTTTAGTTAGRRRRFTCLSRASRAATPAPSRRSPAFRSPASASPASRSRTTSREPRADFGRERLTRRSRRVNMNEFSFISTIPTNSLLQPRFRVSASRLRSTRPSALAGGFVKDLPRRTDLQLLRLASLSDLRSRPLQCLAALVSSLRPRRCLRGCAPRRLPARRRS